MEPRRSARAAAFLADLLAVYRAHGLALGHEDTQGAFEIRELDDDLVDWLEQAIDQTVQQPEPKE